MRLLIDARSLVDARGGGITRVAREIVSALARVSLEDELLCVTTGWRRSQLPAELRRYPNVLHHHLRLPNKIVSLLSMIRAPLIEWYQSARGRCDAVFLPNLAFIGSLPQDLPLILLAHDLSFLMEPTWFSWKERIWHIAVRARTLLRGASYLLAVSQTTKRDLQRCLGIPEDRIAVIPIGATLHRTQTRTEDSPSLSEQSRAPYALAFGWKNPRKNAPTAVAAVRLFNQSFPERALNLVIIGRDLHDVTDEELASLYTRAAVFLYPSWYEGYGLPLHEAARFGTSCVASTTGALPETAPPGTLFAHPAKPHEWAHAIDLALQSPRPLRIQTSDASDAWSRAADILRDVLVRLRSKK